MNSKTNPEIFLIERIRNQLRIHWGWLKNQHSVDMADFIEAIIKNWYEEEEEGKENEIQK